MQELVLRCRSFLSSFGAQLAILAISTPALYVAFATDSPYKWLKLLLVVVFFGIDNLGHYYLFDKRRSFIPLYLIVQSAIVTVLAVVPPATSIYLILYYILSVEAIMVTTLGTGLRWMILFLALTGVSIYQSNGLENMLVSLPIYMGGFFFFASFAYTTKRAELARLESQRLLSELQEAHQQLQEYALQAEDLAVAQERNRLAREMHDTIGHRLTVATVQLEGAQRLIANEPDRAGELVATVREQVREALAELRQSVATLREPLEAGLPLDASLKRLVNNFESATGLSVHLLLPDELPPLSHAHRLALFRTAQEALTNIQRHASAQQAWMQLACSNGLITLRVSDNGVGIPGQAAPAASFGLRGIRERAAQLGGELHLEPRTGGGTQLSFALPLGE